MRQVAEEARDTKENTETPPDQAASAQSSKATEATVGEVEWNQELRLATLVLTSEDGKKTKKHTKQIIIPVNANEGDPVVGKWDDHEQPIAQLTVADYQALQAALEHKRPLKTQEIVL